MQGETRGAFLNLFADGLDVDHDRVWLHRHPGSTHQIRSRADRSSELRENQYYDNE
jgi:hypothetical protein